MSTATPTRVQPSSTDAVRRGLVVVGLGTAALALRPGGWPALVVTIAIGIIGIIGLARPATGRSPHLGREVARASLPLRGRWQAPLVTGAAAMGVGHFVGPDLPSATSATMVAVAIAAAIGEEAFFRGLAHDLLRQRLHSWLVVVVTATLFAAVHLPMYGWAAMPVNLSAGLLFGWQRERSGSWVVPALTHLFANLLVVLA